MAAIARGWLVVETAEGDRRTALLTAAQVERMLEGVGLPANMRHHEGDRRVTAGGARTRPMPHAEGVQEPPLRKRRSWRLTNEEKRIICGLWDNGASVTEIKIRTNRSENSIRRVICDREEGRWRDEGN